MIVSMHVIVFLSCKAWVVGNPRAAANPVAHKLQCTKSIAWQMALKAVAASDVLAAKKESRKNAS